MIAVLILGVAVVGAAVCVGLLWCDNRRRRRAAVRRAARFAAEREARLRVATTCPDAELGADSQPTLHYPATGTGWPSDTVGLRWLRPDLGQPTATLPPIPAPLAGPELSGEDWQRLPADPHMPALLAPDHWEHVQADPDAPTPLTTGLVEPTLPDWVKGSFTQLINRAEFNKHRSLAEWARLDDQEQNGAAR